MNLPMSEAIHDAPALTITIRPIDSGPAAGSSSPSKRTAAGAGRRASRSACRSMPAAARRSPCAGSAGSRPWSRPPRPIRCAAERRSIAMPSKVIRRTPCGAELGQLAVLQHERAARMLEDRRNIGGDEILAVAQAEHQRRRGLGRDQLVGLGLGQHHDRERAAQLAAPSARTASVSPQASACSRSSIRCEISSVSVSELSLWPRPSQRGAQLDVVLDDTVMDDRDRARLVRMGIALRGTAVRRPSRMADSDRGP